MKRLCRNGLHEKTRPGWCVPCRKARRARQNEAQAQYQLTPKGKATAHRYVVSRKGRAAKREWAFLNPN